jgi:hypothetical protein
MLAWALWVASGWPPESRLFPWTVGISVLCLALVQVGVAARNMLRSDQGLQAHASHDKQSFDSNEEAHRSRKDDADRKVIQRRVIIIQSWIVIFFIGIWLLGFKVGALVLTFAFLKVAAHEPWQISMTFSVMSYLFLLVVFDFALEVPLGAGLIADYFELNSLDMYLVKPLLSLI